MITVDKNKTYKLTSLEYLGLVAQIPKGVDLGWQSELFPGEYEYAGSMIYRLLDQGVDVEEKSMAVYGKTLAELSDDLEEFEVKMWDITDPLIREAREDHRTVDYRTALTVPLFPKRTTVRGEVIRVEWYRNEDLTDKVLCAEMEYVRDPYGFATERTTTRCWICKNGQEHPLKKVTKKLYTINTEDQIKEGHRRRQNIVDTVQLPMFGAMQEVLGKMGKGGTEILLIGRSILDDLNDFFKKFIENSSTVTDIADPNIGKKKIVVEFQRMAANEYPWFNDPVALLGGASILQYLVNEFSI